MSLLSQEDERRIEEKIAEIERRTAGEVVVAVVKRSGEYVLGRGLAAFACALAAGFVFLEWRPDLPPVYALFVELAAALLGYALIGLLGLERFLIPNHVAEPSVRARALALFAERGIYRTRQHTGVLVFLSELEHRVVILGDKTIHERLGESGWQAHVDHIVSAVRRGEAARGILEVLDRLGASLAEFVPSEPADVDELSNRVMRERE
jgi:putative membrane protein